MSNSKKLLTDSIIGLVPLNWKYQAHLMEKFLSKISKFGFRGIQISKEQGNSNEFMNFMSKFEIEPAEHYIAIRCDQTGPLDGSEVETSESVELAKLAGVEMIVFAVDGSDDRDRKAGRVTADLELTDDGYQELANHIEKFAKLANSYGVKCSFHPHAATYIETPIETKKLMSLIDKDLVGLCLDVGHWIVGGGDPISAVIEYSNRITHVHVKDVSAKVLNDLLEGRYGTMHDAVVDGKLFVPAGTGVLNLQELFDALDNVNFVGWLMSEQDSAYEPSEEASAVSIKNMNDALGR